jgi:hypothetical protein
MSITHNTRMSGSKLTLSMTKTIQAKAAAQITEYRSSLLFFSMVKVIILVDSGGDNGTISIQYPERNSL